MRYVLWASALALSLGVCGSAVAAPAAANSAAAGRGVRRPAAKQVLPWIEDDWTRAVAQAKARKLPIFVESWAPW